MNRLPIQLTAIPGPRSLALAKELRRYESPNVTYVAADFPIFWEKAAGCWITDVDGNTYLDMTAAFGVAAVGHAHPAVVDAIQRQASTLIHGMGDVHPSDVKVRLCERISRAVTPIDAIEPWQEPAPARSSPPLPKREGKEKCRDRMPWQVILGQNGSDAVEAALKTARLASGKRGVIAFEGGYHGLTYGALNVTSRDDFRAPFADQLGSFTRHLAYGCDIELLDRALVDTAAGAVIVEPIQGRGGIVVPEPGWLASVQACAHRHGALLILDEIFTGWGRTGDLFAHRAEGFVPDILCIGKAMGGGLPISACVAPASIMGAWGESRGEALHTSTFLGNPLACAAALAAIDVIIGDDLSTMARTTGAVLEESLQILCHQYPSVLRNVRGRGLMIGLVTQGRELADSLMRSCLAAGLIVLPAGDGSVIEFVPPLNISLIEIQTACEILNRVLSRLSQ